MDPHRMMPPPLGYMGPPPDGPGGGRVHTGAICSFDAVKGYGFVTPDGLQGLHEDVFYLRGELPPDLKDASREDLVSKRVEFEVVQMPDGKLRAKRMVSTSGLPGGSKRRSTAGAPREVEGKIVKFDRSKG